MSHAVRRTILFLFCLTCLPFFGCDLTKTPSLTKTEADKKFTEVCKKEYGLDVKVRSLDNTVWIYLPLKEPLFEFTVGKQDAPENQKPRPFSVRYFDGGFKESAFHFDYDIVDNKKAPEPQGIGNNPTESFLEKRRQIDNAISQSYFDIGSIPGEVEYSGGKKDFKHKQFMDAHFTRDKAPDFLVIVIADVVTGIEVEKIVNLEDLKRHFTESIPAEEYIKRIVSETRGDVRIKGDTKGDHLDYREIEWPDFLADQTISRVFFQYESSDFPPSADHESEILKCLANATGAYGFDKFNSVRLNNLRQEKDFIFGRDQLRTFAE